MRTFIAADLSEDVVRKIDEVTNYLKTQTPSNTIKWVQAENLHLTVKFLGEVPEDKLERIKALAVDSVKNISSFKFQIEGLGMFPNLRKPRVIWLGILNGKPLADIHTRLDRALSEAGIDRENRPFSPHLTIGRVRRNAMADDISEIGNVLSQFKVSTLGEVHIDHIRLYRSDLKPQGPIYTPLLDIPLNKV